MTDPDTDGTGVRQHALPVSRRTLLGTTGLALTGLPFSSGASAAQKDDTVLFHTDFESAATGTYEPSESPWGGNDIEGGGREEYLAVIDSSSGGVLDARFPAGEAGNGNGGGDFQIRFDKHYRELYLGYRVRFDDEFEFDNAGGKLPGLIGTKGTYAVTGGDDPDEIPGWSARMMWRDPAEPSDGGLALFYTYHPDQPGEYGENMYWDDGCGGQRYFQRGQWHELEHRVVMNTPGENDGIIQGWFDGEKAFDRRDLRFWDSDGNGINKFYFSTFFGGGNDRKWQHDREEHIRFDDVIVSTSPIWNRSPETPDVTLELRRQSGYETGNLYVEHTGGEPLDTDDLTVRAGCAPADAGEGWERSTLVAGEGSWYYAPDTGTEYFEPGQAASIVYEPTSDVVAATTLDETPDATLDISRQSGYETGNLYVEHTGGETLEAAELTVLADEEQTDAGAGWETSQLESGDESTYYAPDSGAEYFMIGQEVEIIHDPTVGVIATETLDE